MEKYFIKLQLINGQWHTYNADNFVVIDSKLEIVIIGSIVSYDFDLIESLSIEKQEDEE